MPRFKVKPENLKDNRIVITEKDDDYRHLVKVLRIQKGDRVVFFDSGYEYITRIEEINSKTVTAVVVELYELDTESPLNITLYQGLLRSSKMELIIQKGTELGIKRIVPVINERSQLSKTNKIPRWQKISFESLKQCRRNHPVIIEEPKRFLDIINSDAIKNEKGLNLLFDKTGRQSLISLVSKLNTNISDVNLFIGPEGGFSEKELLSIKDLNIRKTALGPRILRAETAAIAAITLVQSILGDMK